MDIDRWVVVYISSVVGISSEEIDLHEMMSIYDFDSIDAVEMALEFERTFSREVDPHVFPPSRSDYC